MTPPEQVSLRDFVEKVIEAHDRRHDDLRQADLASLDQYKEETHRALALAKSNAERTLAILLSGIALMISIVTAVFVYFK